MPSQTRPKKSVRYCFTFYFKNFLCDGEQAGTEGRLEYGFCVCDQHFMFLVIHVIYNHTLDDINL